MKNILLIFAIITGVACEETKQSPLSHSHASASRFLKSDYDLNKKTGKARSYYDLQVVAEDLGDTLRLRLSAFNRGSQSQQTFEWLRKSRLGQETARHSEMVRLEPGQAWETELFLAKDELTPGESLFFFFYHLEQGTRHGATQSWQYTPDSLESPSLLQKSNADSPRIRE